jgi:hypothetical protein
MSRIVLLLKSPAHLQNVHQYSYRIQYTADIFGLFPGAKRENIDGKITYIPVFNMRSPIRSYNEVREALSWKHPSVHNGVVIPQLNLMVSFENPRSIESIRIQPR